MFSEHMCPINVDQVIADHSQLNDDYMAAVTRSATSNIVVICVSVIFSLTAPGSRCKLLKICR